MKSIIMPLVLSAALALSPETNGQDQTNSHTTGPRTRATGPPVASDPDPLENDAAFKRLSPDKQQWVRGVMDKLNKAIQQKDIGALDRLKVEVAQMELTGMKFCGDHVLGEGVYLEALALDDSRKDEAFVARWLESERNSNAPHTAVFSTKRCVATDGDILEGKSIVRILPNSLAISNQHGLVAYEALYVDHPGEGLGADVRRGIFIENRFLIELDPRTASPLGGELGDETRDFSWNGEKERLDMRPGVFLAPAPATPAKQ